LRKVVDSGTDPGGGEVSEEGVGEVDETAGGVVKFCEESADGGFSRPRGADDVGQVAGREVEGDIVENKTVWSGRV